MKTPEHERRILWFTLVGHALVHVYDGLFGPLLLAMGGAFLLDVSGITLFVTLTTVCFGLGAFPAGVLGARWGEKRLLVAFFLGSALGGTIIGLASTRTALGVGAVVLGLATSIYHPVGTALVSKGSRRAGWAMGLNGIAGSVGTALGPAYAGLMADALSWRWVFLALTAPSVLLGVWLWASDLGPAAAPRPRPGPGGPGRLDPQRLPAGTIALFSFLLLAMTFGGLYYRMVITMLPLHLAGALSPGMDPDQVARAGGLKAGLALLFGIPGQYLAGILADRFENRRLYVVVLMLATPLVFNLAFTGGSVLIVNACAVAFVMFAVQPIENTVLARYSPERLRSVLYGAKFILTFGVGGMGSALAGRISESRGMGAVFLTAGGFTAGGLICAFTAALVRPTAREAPVRTGSTVSP